MWKLDLSNINTNSSCFDSIMECLLKTFELDYRLLNLKKFTTSHFIKSNDKKWYLTRGKSQYRVYEDVFAMTLTRVKVMWEENEFYKTLQDKLISAPVGCFFDAFDCEWTSFYKIVHINHFVLIVNITTENCQFVDIYYPQKGIITISICEWQKIAKSLLYIEFGGQKHDIYPRAIRFLKNIVEIPEKNQYENEKKSFIDFLTGASYQLICPNKVVNTSPFLLKLKWIAEDKLNFKMALAHLNSDLFKNTFDDLTNVSEEVTYLKNELIRSIISGKIRDEKIVRHIERIYSLNFCISEKLYYALQLK